MKIQNLKTNHFENPLGYRMDYLFLSWEITGTDARTDQWTQIQIAEDEGFQKLVFDSGKMKNYGCPYYSPAFVPLDAVRYYWRVELETDKGEQRMSEAAWFETALPYEEWKSEWISPQSETEAMPCLYKDFSLKKSIKQARLYCYGLGIYECSLNQKKVGNEFLLPGYHAYDFMSEYQTFDVTKQLKQGTNRLAFILGEGWYKGRFVFEGGYENLYGSRKLLTAALLIEYEDGKKERISTDKTWEGIETEVLSNNIYDGEVIDRDRCCKDLLVEVIEEPAGRLIPRLNVPVHKVEKHEAAKIIVTPSGNTVLDFGEAITGWVEVYGEHQMKFCLQYGEHMQNGEFYRDNLRTAKAEFRFKGMADNEWLRPHFTYYGFRYVLVKGIREIKKENFVAYRLMSDIEQTGKIRTSNQEVNQLFENTLRSQKCNFLEIPMDCPQRDERMGWTGDIGIFARTGSFHMYTPAFLHHYMMNLGAEQIPLGGAVPFFVPRPKPRPHEGINPFLVTAGACTWGDAATIIPWELYLHYRDMSMLSMHYPIMCGWVEYVNARVRENKIPGLWQNDRQLGDWLALDNGDTNNPVGKTDCGFIASAYYYYSTMLCCKAAKALKKEADAVKWKQQALAIKEAFLKEYFDGTGDLKGSRTQTAYGIALYMGLYEQEKREVLTEGLKKLLEEWNYHLSTGFVGTGILMQALSAHGLKKEAYTLLLQEDYPSWIRELRLGATTIWERWNSVNDDGSICDTDMNSLNHYAYGSVAGWMYETMCGFKWDEEGEFYLRPQPDERIKEMEGRYRTMFGDCLVRWIYQEKSRVRITIQIPFQAKVRVELPWGEKKVLETGIHVFQE